MDLGKELREWQVEPLQFPQPAAVPEPAPAEPVPVEPPAQE